LIDAYRWMPKRLTVEFINKLASDGAHVPRYFVLALCREKEAQTKAKEQLRKHVIYRQMVQKQLDQRLEALETQRVREETERQIQMESIEDVSEELKAATLYPEGICFFNQF
jgi:hypothetical protein